MAKKALDGITVIDFTQLLAGPYATQMLGDLGAEVIKVERLKSGDLFRGMDHLGKKMGENLSPQYMAWNRNKKSISLDVRKEAGRNIIYKMIETADVVVENFRPGVMDRLGLGYEKLKTINPRIVYASNSGYGPSGPYVTRPGQDQLIQGLCGMMTFVGSKKDGPVPIGPVLADALSSLNLVYGILAGLLYVQKTGKGQHIEVDLMRSMLAMQSEAFFGMLNLDIHVERPDSGIAHPMYGVPFGVYKCADGYLTIAMNPFDKVVKVLEAPELLTYMENDELFSKRDEIFYRMQDIMMKKAGGLLAGKNAGRGSLGSKSPGYGRGREGSTGTAHGCHKVLSASGMRRCQVYFFGADDE
ncbi:CaiB/BaiF CoA-transferase family protein [uncultured Dysosmobacter sp.]|uniref:CaiB/BaiF CoA transferase family protein n=1 Tax=uncultured Dysosmobacter sp. TaxID=2591384 RepID=UPI002623F53A|nr:CoA transferase [uncultured Dysosmobacter sp.]